MSPDRRRLLLWAGAAGVVVVAGFAWTHLAGTGRSETAAKADALHASYRKLYHPDKPAGLAVDAAQTELRELARKQSDELTATSVPLAPPIPSAYLAGSLSEAATQVNADYTALRQLAARNKVALPQSLPFESGLDADAQARGRQLANLALIRQGVQACINAGVQRITGISPGLPAAAPGGDYASFVCDIEVDGDWPAVARLLAALAQADGRGLGLRSAELATTADRSLHAKLAMTLTTVNRESWGLEEMKPAAAAASPGSQPGGTAGSRLRRPTAGARP